MPSSNSIGGQGTQREGTSARRTDPGTVSKGTGLAGLTQHPSCCPGRRHSALHPAASARTLGSAAWLLPRSHPVLCVLLEHVALPHPLCHQRGSPPPAWPKLAPSHPQGSAEVHLLGEPPPTRPSFSLPCSLNPDFYLFPSRSGPQFVATSLTGCSHCPTT